MASFGIDPYGGGTRGRVTYVNNGQVTQTGGHAAPMAFNGTIPMGYVANPARPEVIDQDHSVTYGGGRPPRVTERSRSRSFDDGDDPVGVTYPQVPLPNPQQLDQVNRVQEASQYRQQQRGNFQHSLDVTRNQATTSAGAFAAAKTSGLDDRSARRHAYLVTHGQTGLIPTEAVAAADPAQQQQAPGVDKQAKAYRDLVGDGIAPGMDPSDAQHIVGFPSTQPSVPMPAAGAAQAARPTTAPTSQPAVPLQGATSEFANPEGNQTPLTTQAAHSMWEVINSQNPQMQDGQRRRLFIDKVGEYGHSEAQALSLLGQMDDKGTLNQRSTDLVPGKTTLTPALPVPRSLLGTDKTGPQYTAGDGMDRRVVDNQRAMNQAAVPVTSYEQRGPQPGNTPIAQMNRPPVDTSKAGVNAAPDGSVAFSPTTGKKYVKRGGTWAEQ